MQSINPQVLFATVAANLKFVSSNLFLKQMLSCIILVSAWLDRAENKVCKRVGTGNFLELNFVLASFLTALFVIKTFCDRFLLPLLWWTIYFMLHCVLLDFSCRKSFLMLLVPNWYLSHQTRMSCFVEAELGNTAQSFLQFCKRGCRAG